MDNGFRLLGDISDTARWVAVFRAIESERSDAHFRDPFARQLADKRGEEIAEIMQGGNRTQFIIAVRTKIIDDLILESVTNNHIDAVLNLAAGLDTRPYRLPLPPGLRWFEADLPGLVAYKQEKLRGEIPTCHYVLTALDLTAPEARQALFQRVAAVSKRVLVLTEGLLVYLPESEVVSLAKDMYAHPAFSRWIIDYASPEDIDWVEQNWGPHFSTANIQMQFAPEEGPEFFAPLGWRVTRQHPFQSEARRLHREPSGLKVQRWLSRVGLVRKQPFEKRSGIALLERR